MIALKAASQPIEANKLLLKADSYNNGNNYDSAIFYYRKYLSLSQNLGKFRNYQKEADVNRRIANNYQVTGKYSSAKDYYFEALQLDSLDENYLGITQDYQFIGMNFIFNNEYKLGIEYLEKALKKAKSFGKTRKNHKLILLADIYLSLSMIYATIGKFEEGKLYSYKAEGYYLKAKESVGYAKALLHSGWISIETGEIEEGKQKVIRSAEIFEKTDLYPLNQLITLSIALEKEGFLEESLQKRLEAVKLAELTGNIPQIIWVYLKTGDTYSILGVAEKAEDYYTKANVLNQQLESSNLTASIQYRSGDIEKAKDYFVSNNMIYGSGITNLRLGKINENRSVDSAIYYYSNAADFFEKLDYKENYYLAKVLLANQWTENNMATKALEVLNTIIKNIELPVNKWQAHYIMGKAYENLESQDSAIVHYRKAVSIIEDFLGRINVEDYKSSFLENKIDVYDRLIQLLEQKGKSEEAFYFSEKARARTFLDLIEGKNISYISSGDSIFQYQEKLLIADIQKLLRQVQNQRTLLNKQDSGSFKKVLAEKQKEYEELLVTASKGDTKIARLHNQEISNIKKVQEHLSNKQAIIDYWSGEKQLIIWLIKRDTFISKVLYYPSNLLAHEIELTRRAINQGEQAAQKYLKRLYSMLWSPVEKYLTEVEYVTIIPHQSLHFFPFSALYDQSYLVEKYILSNSISATYLTSENEPDTRAKSFGVAISETNSYLSDLKGTQEEMVILERYFKNLEILKNEEANEDIVSKKMENSRIIHLATHGIYNKYEPLNSYLLLNPSTESDGKLMIREILGMNLQSDLLTLSACETAIGKLSHGDELVGFNRAFLLSGASKVMASLWKISDEKTPILINYFYNYLLKGNTVSTSLSLAQRDFIRNNNSNPFYWAAFIVN